MDVSIIITTTTTINSFQKCLWSCLSQISSGLDYEIIVVVDGSTDNTANILSTIKDSKVTCYTIDNCGIEKASNYGFSKAKGEIYIVRVDADDIFYPITFWHEKFYTERNSILFILIIR